MIAIFLLAGIGSYILKSDFPDIKEWVDSFHSSHEGENSSGNFKNNDLYIPFGKYEDQHISHSYYQAGYSYKHKQSEYVFYVSKVEYLKHNFKRKGIRFKKDPLLANFFALDKDYINSGYDRGHLLPAEDMRFNEEALKETFYLTNVSPQNPSFNRGIWLELENLVRKWVKEYGELIVIAGPVLENEKGDINSSIGVNKDITVPWAFYKIIIRKSEPNDKVIAFLIPNKAFEKPYPSLSNFLVSLCELREITGIQFFYQLPPSWHERQGCSVPTMNELEAS